MTTIILLEEAARSGLVNTGGHDVPSGEFLTVEMNIAAADLEVAGGDITLDIFQLGAGPRELVGTGDVTTSGEWTDKFGVTHDSGATPVITLGESFNGKRIQVRLDTSRTMTYSVEVTY